jgi:outer membrane protein TolC
MYGADWTRRQRLHKAGLQASREDLALARLSAQASLVQTYVAIRTAEQQHGRC